MENCLPDFWRHENHYRLDGGEDPETGHNARFLDFHGHGGEWRVEKQRLRWEILEAFADAAEQTGFLRTDDFNTGDNSGVRYLELNQESGLRWNASKAFLRPAKARGSLEIWTGAQVEKLVFNPGADGRQRCAGAIVRRGRQPSLFAPRRKSFSQRARSGRRRSFSSREWVRPQSSCLTASR